MPLDNLEKLCELIKDSSATSENHCEIIEGTFRDVIIDRLHPK